jgi:predicted ATP-grasp superfamily ATP-dependent carboligase
MRVILVYRPVGGAGGAAFNITWFKDQLDITAAGWKEAIGQHFTHGFVQGNSHDIRCIECIGDCWDFCAANPGSTA